MSTAESSSEILARTLLESANFTVERLKATRLRGKQRRSADYFVSDGCQTYLVEVTEREPEISYRDFIQSVASAGSATLVRTMDRSKALDDKLTDKRSQLAETLKEADFKTIWVTAQHDDAEHVCEVLVRTLYGIADLFGVRNPNDPEAFPPTNLECIYFDDFAFKDCRDVDGVAFVSESAVCMCVNPLCSRVTAFRESRMASEFRQRSSLVDPASWVGLDDVLFLDHEIDRSDPRNQWRAIREKYGWYTTRTRDSCFQGEIRIPVKNLL